MAGQLSAAGARQLALVGRRSLCTLQLLLLRFARMLPRMIDSSPRSIASFFA
jgi:hypothetical protein